MMPNITRGKDAGGLVRYLAGPGDKNEHTQQHVIGGSLGYSGDLDRDMVRQVTADLRAPGLAHPEVTVKAGEIWHCSLSIKAGEGVLSDEKWRAIAGDFMQRMGFDDPKKAPARWVAVRHGFSAEGNDHIHIAASVIREDGRRVDTRRDWPRAQAAAHAIEHAHGLDVLGSRQAGTGSRGLSAAELRRAAQSGPTAVPERVELEATVRAAAGASRTEMEFVRRLRKQGVQVRAVRIVDRKRVDLSSGPASGYAVARADGNVWFGGGTLSRDLTLPRLRTGWAGAPPAGSDWAAPITAGREAQPVRVNRSTFAAATTELRGLERRLRAGHMTPAQVADAAQAVSGALSAAAGLPAPRPPLDATQVAAAREKAAGLPAVARGRRPGAPGRSEDLRTAVPGGSAPRPPLDATQVAAAREKAAGLPAVARGRRPGAPGRSEDLRTAARDAGRLAGSRAAAAPRRRLALSAALLLVQAAERDSSVAQGIMVRQLMATYRAVQDAHRAIGAGRMGGVHVSDGLEEPIEGLATVAVTVGARMIEAHARNKEEAAQKAAQEAARSQRAAQSEAIAVNGGGGVPGASRVPPQDRHPSQWATGDQVMTSKQKFTLVQMGYQPDELRNMSKADASLHISGERSRDDLGKAPTMRSTADGAAHGATPSTSGTGGSSASSGDVNDLAPRRDPNLDLHRRRAQDQRQRRGRK